MPENRITEQRKKFVELLSQNTRITFRDLKNGLVWKKWEEGMNLATLYRIIDAFEAQWLLHEMEVAGERVIFPCQCENPGKEDAVSISFCENCGMIYDVHTKLSSPYISSMTYARMKSCRSCVL